MAHMARGLEKNPNPALHATKYVKQSPKDTEAAEETIV